MTSFPVINIVRVKRMFVLSQADGMCLAEAIQVHTDTHV